ncbi:MAG: YCF48-related protein [Terriglobia bacterium]
MNEETAEEKGLGQLIAAKLRKQMGDPSRSTGECPTAETLACYFDQTLSEAERDAFDTHLLGCPRCQDHLAELARLSEADDPQTLIHADEAPAPAEEKPSAGWHFNLAWAGLALGLIVVAGVWQWPNIAPYLKPPSETAQNTVTPVPESPGALLKKNGVSIQAAKRETPGSAPVRAGTATSVARESSWEKHAPSADQLAKPKSAAQPATMARITSQQEPRAVAEVNAGAERGAMATPSERAGLGAVVLPSGRSIELKPEKPNLQLGDSGASGTNLSVAPPPTAPAPANMTARTDQAAAEAASGAPKLMIQGVAPRYAPKWRVGRRGVIQKADPDGNWITVGSGVDTDLFDISFAGSKAGWAVGHGGLVLRTTDGGDTWAKTPSPTTEDLIHVSATSELAARVITRRNILYSTSDGGNTWSSQQQ